MCAHSLHWKQAYQVLILIQCKLLQSIASLLVKTFHIILNVENAGWGALVGIIQCKKRFCN